LKFSKWMSPLLASAAAVVCAAPRVPQSATLSSDAATVRVVIDSHSVSPIEPGFAGYNVALMDVAFGYRDRRFASQVKRLGPGWLRYPAGTRSEAFDWTTGTSHPSWIDRASLTFSRDVQSDFRTILQRTLEVLEAKGGEHIDDAASLAASAGAQGLIVCVNVFTDTPASARRFSEYVRHHHLRVLGWELGNEPYFNRKLWPTASAYAAAVRPFADAIRAGDSSASIGVSMSDAGFTDHAWDDSLAAFRPRYWDFVIYHHYPTTVHGSPAEMMAALNHVLLHGTTDYLRDEVASRFGSMPVMITEVGPQDGPGPGMSGTIYGGIWSAEYALRMSSVPQVKYFGIHQLVGAAGVGVTHRFVRELIASWSSGHRLQTDSLDFGLFESAQGAAYALAASVIDSSTATYRTRVEGGGRAPLPRHDSASAMFAAAYRLRGQPVVVTTNKGAGEETVAIVVDGRPVQGPFNVITVSAADPSQRNTAGNEAVAARSFVASGLIRVAPYSVVRISW
jgi:hypothetical protein